MLWLGTPLAGTGQTIPSNVPLPTYSAATAVDVKPNILFVLDDSLSMTSDYLPDWANDRPSNYTSLPDYLSRNPAFNGVAYDPAVNYLPPLRFNSDGSRDTRSYPSMDGQSEASGADTGAKPNWRAVPSDGYGVQSTAKLDLEKKASFWTTIAGEYCNSPALTTCIESTSASGKHAYPAPLRWCDSAALTACRGLYGGNYKIPRMPAPRVATLRFSAANRGSVTSLIVDNLQIMAKATDPASTPADVALRVADAIKACNLALSGNCKTVGFDAFASGSTVTVLSPRAISSTPVLASAGILSATVTPFDRSTIPLAPWRTTASSAPVPGETLFTTITSTVTSYPYPGSSTKAATRTDCAGSTCTYQEEMTNYANWHAYYRTRMQLMKTATARAFATLEASADAAAGRSRFRVGYMSINNNTGTDFANLADFGTDQKLIWFSKLFAAKPDKGTPLRRALSQAGQLYAGRLNGTTFNGVTVSDPLQYSCQRNFTILSTDGYWNGAAGTKLDGSTDIGNQDGKLARPYQDGTSSQLQSRFSYLQQQTSTYVPVAGRSGKTQLEVGPWVVVNSCTPRQPSTPGSGTITECRYTPWTSWANDKSCTPAPQSTGPSYAGPVARECQTVSTGGTSDTLADVAAYYYATDLRNPHASGADATGTCTGPTLPSATRANDLCTDNVPVLGRNVNSRQHMVTHGLSLGAQGNMVFSPYQNNAQGQRVYVPHYASQPSGDFFDVANGTPASPATGICPWQASGTCAWPKPADNSSANVDDLWHAAVNGRGTYFSARDPVTLADSLRSVLNEIVQVPRPGTVAAAATSNPNVTTADNFVFSSSYVSLEWYGDLVMQQIGTDGRLGKPQWSARQLLDCVSTPWRAGHSYARGAVYHADQRCWYVDKVYTAGNAFGDTDLANALRIGPQPAARTIHTVGDGGLTPFTWSSLSSTQRAYFDRPVLESQTPGSGLSQFCQTGSHCLSDSARADASGETLVNYLRGDRTHEGSYYRSRRHVLGDIVTSEARYVRAPLNDYKDPGHAEFKAAQSRRAPTVYVGANDGMLHAFDAGTGAERWAFIPAAVLPELYRLADTEYSANHRYYVDGSPEVGDICPTAPSTHCSATGWKTLLVGGLNLGGKAFYALDVTDPAAPRYLWEFRHPRLGLSYSNPRITKLKSGRWVVLVASGYGVDDGVGRLFVLDAYSGTLLTTHTTQTGTPAAEAGLARIAARAPRTSTDNTVEAVYGGDLLGNVWRFDVNDTLASSSGSGVAQRLVQLRDPEGKPQPVTMRPTVTTINGNPAVIVGTGRYLTLSDLDTRQTQSLYAIQDKGTSTPLATPRSSGSQFVQQTITGTTCPEGTHASVCSPGQAVRTASRNPVNWAVHNGWYLDLPASGERATSDATLAMGTLALTTLVPQAAGGGTAQACTADAPPGAKSYLYFLDYLTGGAIGGSNGVVGLFIADGVATRVSVFRKTDGTLRGITRVSGLSAGPASEPVGDPDSPDQACLGCASDVNGSVESDILTNPAGSGIPARRSWRVLDGAE